MNAKTAYLQIRLSPEQKAALLRFAERAGQTLSAYVLDRVLPAPRLRFDEIVQALVDEDEPSFPLAALNDMLTDLAPAEFRDAVSDARVEDLSPHLKNYVAAMIEQAAHDKDVAPPKWVRGVKPLEEPRFATSLHGLRLHLLTAAPVPFKRRNIFVDSAVGDRV